MAAYYALNTQVSISLQEIKHLKDKVQNAKSNTSVDVQIQLAETSQELLLEVIASRAKMEEMRQNSLERERETREKVKEEYDQLILNMFASSFDIMQKFDKYRWEIGQALARNLIYWWESWQL